MTNKIKAWSLAALCALSLGSGRLASAAETAPDPVAPGRFSGLIFGDFYDVAAHHIGKLQGLDGFWIRRIFLTYDKDLNENISWRLRMEAASEDFSKASTTLQPWIKDAWIRWSPADGPKFYLGLMESPAFGWLDKQWGLRSVEKSPLDLQGWIPTREQGLGVEGKLNATGYFLTAGNGSAESSEGNDNGKRVSLRVERGGGPGFSAQLYGDAASSAAGSFAPDSWTYTLMAFAGWKGDVGRLGATYGRQVLVLPRTGDEKAKDLVSAYAAVQVLPTLQGFARVDHMLWGSVEKAGLKYLNLAPQRGTLAILGVDWKATPDLSLQPNVELCYYQNDAGGAVSSQDVIPRLSFLLNF